MSELKSIPPVGHVDPKAPVQEQIMALNDLIMKRPENSRILTISPELAEHILATMNDHNRKYKPARVTRYSEAMTTGNWLLTGEPLIFSKLGRLLDGQNRLAASVKANLPFRTHCVFNIDDGVFTALDSGKSRNAGDVFYISGIKYPGTVSAATRWLMIYAAGDPTARTSFSNQDMYSYYNTTVNGNDLLLAIEAAHKANKTFPRAALAAHIYMFAKKHGALARKFCHDLDKNVGGARSLSVCLHNARKANAGRLNDVVINALIVQTWNAYREGRKINVRKDLRWDGTSSDYPTIK